MCEDDPARPGDVVFAWREGGLGIMHSYISSHRRPRFSDLWEQLAGAAVFVGRTKTDTYTTGSATALSMRGATRGLCSTTGGSFPNLGLSD
jgi:hypothetical protein